LIGKIGSFPAFEIGKAFTFGAGKGGPLLVGVNDDQVVDNARGWTVTIRVTTPSPAPPAPTASSKSKSSSIAVILIAVAGVGLVALIALLFWRNRRRSRDADSTQPVPAPAPKPVPVPVAAAASAPVGDAALPSLLAVTPEGEVTAGNILEVAFEGTRALRVGYDHFPEGTVVHWRITQHTTVMTGEFETPDGRSAGHVVTLRLESELDAAEAADIAFTWSIAGVPFNYAVRRNPEA
jgi:hypothetical protein